MPYKASLNKKQSRQLRNTLKAIKGAVPRVMMRASNRSVVTGRKLIQRHIRQELALKTADVNSRIEIKKANKASPNAFIRIEFKPVGLIKYGAKQTKRGVTVRVRKSGKREKLRHAFIAKAGTADQVFERTELSPGRHARRLPIERQVGPSVLGVLKGKPGLLSFIVAEIRETQRKNVARQIKFELEKAAKRRG